MKESRQLVLKIDLTNAVCGCDAIFDALSVVGAFASINVHKSEITYLQFMYETIISLVCSHLLSNSSYTWQQLVNYICNDSSVLICLQFMYETISSLSSELFSKPGTSHGA